MPDVKGRPVTPPRTAKRQREQPLSVTEALLHLRDRARIMRGKNQDVWLRWNRADVEAVETIYAAIQSKAAPTEETTMFEITPFTITVEANGPDEAREIAEELAAEVMAQARRARATRNGTRRSRLLGKIRHVNVLVAANA